MTFIGIIRRYLPRIDKDFRVFVCEYKTGHPAPWYPEFDYPPYSSIWLGCRDKLDELWYEI